MKPFLELIDALLEGKISYNEFENKLESSFFNHDAPHSLSEKEGEFIHDIYDRTTYTGTVVPKEDSDRKYGIINVPDFMMWLLELKRVNIQYWRENGLPTEEEIIAKHNQSERGRLGWLK